MPDVLLTEAGDRLLQQDGSAILLEELPVGRGSTLRAVSGAAVLPLRIAGASVTPYVAREPRATPKIGVS